MMVFGFEELSETAVLATKFLKDFLDEIVSPDTAYTLPSTSTSTFLQKEEEEGIRGDEGVMGHLEEEEEEAVSYEET